MRVKIFKEYKKEDNNQPIGKGGIDASEDGTGKKYYSMTDMMNIDKK